MTKGHFTTLIVSAGLAVIAGTAEAGMLRLCNRADSGAYAGFAHAPGGNATQWTSEGVFHLPPNSCADFLGSPAAVQAYVLIARQDAEGYWVVTPPRESLVIVNGAAGHRIGPFPVCASGSGDFRRVTGPDALDDCPEGWFAEAAFWVATSAAGTATVDLYD